MAIKRIIVGVILGVLVAGGVATAAHAEPAVARSAATTAADHTAAAVSPGISPAAERIRFVGLFDSYDCPLGRACLAVWDPTRTAYKVFDLFRCGTYRLSFWHDQGTMKNNQTGGAAVWLFDGSGNPIESSPKPPTGNDAFYEVDWDPVWSVKPC